MNIEQGSIQCSIIQDEDGQPFMVFSVQDENEEFVVPPVVINYRVAQNLLGFIADFLIEADDYYHADED